MASLYFYYSSMNSGKTTTLLQADFNYREKGMKTLLFNAKLDDRSGQAGVIHSRIGIQADSYAFEPDTSLIEVLREHMFNNEVDAIMVDEAQFLVERQVKELARVAAELEIPVMCYGLRTDFQGNLFEGSKWLLGWADKLTEIKGVCFCGKASRMVLRLNEDGSVQNDGDQIQVGGNSMYESVCMKHFLQISSGRGVLPPKKG